MFLILTCFELEKCFCGTLQIFCHTLITFNLMNFANLNPQLNTNKKEVSNFLYQLGEMISRSLGVCICRLDLPLNTTAAATFPFGQKQWWSKLNLHISRIIFNIYGYFTQLFGLMWSSEQKKWNKLTIL